MQFHRIAAMKTSKLITFLSICKTSVPFGIDEMFAAFGRVTTPVQMDLGELVNAIHSAARDVRRFLFGIVSRQIVGRCLEKSKEKNQNWT
jgi:hypothetical protein